MRISNFLASHAVEELLQLGYTVRDGDLYPPADSREWDALVAARFQRMSAGPAVPRTAASRETVAVDRGGFELLTEKLCFPSFQARVGPWLDACFGHQIASNQDERNHRFLEEAIELVQANGCTASEAHQLVDYVFGRPAGEPAQEVGGVMVTLAALCLASGLDMHEAAEDELVRISTPEMTAKIRAKQAAKPKHSPLPGPTASAKPLA